MASIVKKETKKGNLFYEIYVSRGRNLPRLTTRWYPPEGWSHKAIERELNRYAFEFEQQCKSGEILSKAESKVKEQTLALETAQIKTLKQYCESVFMPDLTIRCSENTRYSYQNNLDHWIYPALGNFKLPDITPSQISALLLAMQNKKKSHATVIKCYTILRSIFKRAYMTDEAIAINPMWKVERPKPRKSEVKKKGVEFHTATEMKYIQECLEKEPLQWRALIFLLIDTGARRGECCALQWPNINFKTNEITFKDNLCYTPDKGVYLDTLKNQEEKTMDVSPYVIDLLWQLRENQANKGISKFVFTKDNSIEPINPQSPTAYLPKFAKKYGISYTHPHKLRHTFASIAIINGADIASVSEKLGHSDKAITLRMYTHADKASIKRAGDIFRESIKQA